MYICKLEIPQSQIAFGYLPECRLPNCLRLAAETTSIIVERTLIVEDSHYHPFGSDMSETTLT